MDKDIYLFIFILEFLNNNTLLYILYDINDVIKCTITFKLLLLLCKALATDYRILRILFINIKALQV